MVCLKKMLNGEMIFHFKKETEKIELLQMKGLIQTSSGLKRYLCTARFSINHKTSFEGHEILCSMYTILYK